MVMALAGAMEMVMEGDMGEELEELGVLEVLEVLEVLDLMDLATIQLGMDLVVETETGEAAGMKGGTVMVEEMDVEDVPEELVELE